MDAKNFSIHGHQHKLKQTATTGQYRMLIPIAWYYSKTDYSIPVIPVAS